MGIMPNYSAISVVNEFLRRRGKDIRPQQMFIQKLAYIANGWNLAINNEPLIEENAEAWDNGPVYRSVWNHIRDNGYKGEFCTLVDPFNGEVIQADLNQEESNIVNHVWAKYGKMNAHELSKMTHEPNTPWSKAYFDRGRNSELNNEEIKSHYIALALAGRGK